MEPWTFVVLFFVLVVAAALIFVIYKSREPRVAVEPIPCSDWLTWIAGLVGLGITLYDWIALQSQTIHWLPLTFGALLILAGLCVRVLSRRALGRFYTSRLSILEGHELVTTGIYRRIRHPGYLGFLLLAVGISVAFSSWLGVVAMLGLFFPSLVYRIGQEERLLTAHFGEAYREYAARSKRLIPGIF